MFSFVFGVDRGNGCTLTDSAIDNEEQTIGVTYGLMLAIAHAAAASIWVSCGCEIERRSSCLEVLMKFLQSFEFQRQALVRKTRVGRSERERIEDNTRDTHVVPHSCDLIY
jgi:hypothetical protein